MSSDPDPLSAKMSARLCHDMVNPLGAISNGLELLEMTGLADGPELELIRASVNEATARLKFLRLAFGPGTPDAMMARDEVLAALYPRFSQTPTTVSWEAPQNVSRAAVKAVFLALMTLEHVTARGGEIAVQARSGLWHIRARSPKPLLDDTVWQLFAPETATADPPANQIHAGALVRHMAPADRAIRIDRHGDGVELVLTI